MSYYPGSTFILGLTTIRRERRLPEGAVGEALVQDNMDVEAQDVLLRGSMPGDFLILDVKELLKLKKAEEFTPEMVVAQRGPVIEKGAVIVQKGTGRSAKTIKSPVRALLARVEGTQVVLQVNPAPVEVVAMCPGRVTSVRSREVLLETTGALIQCAWGNNQRTYSAYRIEPSEGIEAIQNDSLSNEYRNVALVMNRPIDSITIFRAAQVLETTAIVAPSMRADLRELVLKQKLPVILTDGFGERKMSDSVYNLLQTNQGRPALFDATEPQRWLSNLPEIIIPLPMGAVTAPTPKADLPLVEGATVRILRAPYAGKSGLVVRVLSKPRSIENGLRAMGAEVRMASGEVVFVPLANLELLGKIDNMPGAGGA